MIERSSAAAPLRAAAVAVLFLGAGMVATPERAAADTASLSPVTHATAWLDRRVTPESLMDKVVLVDVFTIGCINCENVTPNLRRLNDTRAAKGLVVVGIHTPETPAERDRSAVAGNLANLGVTWPVALDNDQTLWNAYHVSAWPTQLIFDRHGRLRKTIVGDSQDAEVNAIVVRLLTPRPAARAGCSPTVARS